MLRVILLPNPPEIVLSAREFSVERGGAVVYTARLSARPEGDVDVQVGQEGGCNLILSPDTLTFTSDSWNTQQTVTARVRGSTTPGDCTISHTATIGGTGENVITLEAAATIAVTDNLTQPTRVQSLLVPATLTLAEDSTFQYDLDVDPGGGTPVTVTFSSDNSDVRVSRDQYEFTNADSFAATSTVTAGQDDDAVDDPFKIIHQVSGNNIVVVSGVIADDDRLGISTSPSALSLPEGGQGEYRVRLTARPEGNTNVYFGGVTSGIGVDGPCGSDPPARLRFTTDNWDEPQTVTIRTCQDNDDKDDIPFVTHRVFNKPSCRQTFTEDCRTILVGEVFIQTIDDDTSGLTIEPRSIALREGDLEEYSVRMDFPPPGEVTVTISKPGSADVEVSPDSPTFTAEDWNVPKTVTVTALQDDDYTQEGFRITHRTSLSDINTFVHVSVSDDDVRPDSAFDGCDSTEGDRCHISNVPEGESREYTIRLDQAPLTDVTVSISNSEPTLVDVSQRDITFTPANWDQPRTVRVTVIGLLTGPDSPTTATLTHTANGAGYRNYRIGRVVVSKEIRPGFYFTGCQPPAGRLDVARCDLFEIIQNTSGEYGMKLRRQPVSDVVVVVTHRDTPYVDLKQTAGGEALDRLEFTFTPENWDTTRFAYFTARDIGAAQQQMDTLLHTANGSGYDDRLVGEFPVQVIDRDRRPPRAVRVRDGLDATADEDFNDGSLTDLSANWTFVDAHSDITGYKVALGTACGETDVADWSTDWSPETSVTLTDLSLRTGRTYYFSVRARDAAGNISDVIADSCEHITSEVVGLHRPFSDGVAVLPVLDVSVRSARRWLKRDASPRTKTAPSRSPFSPTPTGDSER